MNNEISFIVQQLQDAYDGKPWFGRCVKELLHQADEQTAFQRPGNQHSVLELLWHMITWREFVLDRLQSQKPAAYFDDKDWRPLDHNDKTLWPQGLQRLQQTQEDLIGLLQRQDDSRLEQTVNERTYNFRKLLHGLVQHDIYHAGQIAYINKLLKASSIPQGGS